MFSEKIERNFKEKRFSQNYTVLNFNESHVISLDDLVYEKMDKKLEDDPYGKKISFRATYEEEESFGEKNHSKNLAISFHIFWLIFTAVLISS